MDELELVLEALPGLGVLSLLMSVDILSAVIRSAMNGEVMSQRLIRGVSIKAGILVIVGLAFAIDITVARFMPWAKPHIPVYVGKVVAAWYMLGEFLSILENLYRMGVPMPRFLTRVLAVARSHVSASVHIPKMEVDELNVRRTRRGPAKRE